jgi:hypothetical protein
VSGHRRQPARSRKSSAPATLKPSMLRAATFLTALVLLIPAAAANAQTPGEGFAQNAELVQNFAIGPSSGGKLLGDHFYITTGRSVHIYDVKDAENPVEVGTADIPNPDPQAQRAPEEDPDTNGKILLATYSDQLIVFDVSDKTDPKVLSTLDGIVQHTISCILDCTWAYGSEGDIVDLRDPKSPKLAGNWVEDNSPGSTHDVTEVAPGFVMTSTQPIMLLDARDNPAKPKKIAEAEPPGFVHATLWPHQMQDRILLVGGESLGPQCAENKDATFQTWDTSNWRQTSTFKLIAEYTMETGVPPLTGTTPAVTFCTHWFEPNATYRDGGLVGIGWYENGTRFLKIGLDGSIEEVGYFIPMGTRSSGVYFRNDRIAYIADYYRGFDVVRFTGDMPPNAAAPNTPGGPQGGNPASPAPVPLTGGEASSPKSASFSDLVKLPSKCTTAKRFRISLRKSADPVTALTIRVGKAKAKTFKGSKLKKIRFKKLPKKKFTLQVQVRTRSGHKTAGQRSYRGCR